MFSHPSCSARIPVPALLIEGKVDETAQGAADVALTYADPVPWWIPVDPGGSHGRKPWGI